MAKTETLVYKYLREYKKFPTVWCAGCGNGIILGAIIRAIDGLNIDRNDIAMVSGIGCSSRMPVYVDFNTLHTTHGRALPFATGIKLAKPKMKVIVVTGDGDAIAIGGNHFIHAARRNIDLTVIVVNNFIYGMTGGQVSPASPQGTIAATAPYGNIGQPIDICELAKDCGARFVARSSVYHFLEMEKFIRQALEKKGFSMVEVLSNCHTNYGRHNNIKTATDMLMWFKNNTAPIDSPASLENKIPRGVFVDREVVEYTDCYSTLVCTLAGK